MAWARAECRQKIHVRLRAKPGTKSGTKMSKFSLIWPDANFRKCLQIAHVPDPLKVTHNRRVRNPKVAAVSAL